MFSLWFPISSPILLSQCTSLILTFPIFLPGSAYQSLSVCLCSALSLLVLCLSACLPTPHISCFLFLSINLFIDCLLYLPLFCVSAPRANPPHLFPPLSALTPLISQPARLPPSLLSLVVPPCHSLSLNHCLDYLCLPPLGSLPVSLSLFLFFSLFRSILPSLRFGFISSVCNSLSRYFCQGSSVLHSISLCLCLFCAANPLSSCLSLNLCTSFSTSASSFFSSAFWQEFFF